MNRYGWAMKDRVVAEGLEKLSSVTARFPVLRSLIENSSSPSHVSARWRHARIPADSISNWVVHQGISGAGRTPQGYPEAVILGISKPEVDAYAAEHGGRHALAYALGSTVMVGIMEEEEIFGIDEERQQYLVAMGIGPGVLKAAAGLVLGKRQLWLPMSAIEDRGRMLVDEIPISVPYV